MAQTSKVFKNTFAPACTNETLTVGAIIVGLGHGFFTYDRLPQNVRNAVDAEMERRDSIAANPALRPEPDETWKLDILDACLNPRQNPSGARRLEHVRPRFPRPVVLSRQEPARDQAMSPAAQSPSGARRLEHVRPRFPRPMVLSRQEPARDQAMSPAAQNLQEVAPLVRPRCVPA